MWKLVPIIIVCLILAFFSDVFSKKDALHNKYIYQEKIFWFLIVIVISVFAGLRIRYNDTRTYIEEYIYFTNDILDFSEFDLALGSNPGFCFVNMLLKKLHFSINGYLMIYSLITYSIYIWFIRKYSSDFLMSIVLFICLALTFPMAAIKQCVAVAFCLIAVDKAINKKWFWFVFWILVAETFHAYSFMYFAVPFLFFVPWKSKKTYLWIGLFFFAGIMLRPFMGTLLSITDSLGDNYTYEEFSREGVNPFRLAVSLVPLIMSFILQKKVTDPKYEMTRSDNVCMNLSFLNGEIMFVALFGTANYFARLANYFYIFPLISIPRLLNMIEPKWRTPVKLAAILCYSFFLWYNNIYSGFNPFDVGFDRISLSEFYWFEKI